MSIKYSNENIATPSSLLTRNRLSTISDPGPHFLPNAFGGDVQEGYWFEVRIAIQQVTLQTLDGTVFFESSTNSIILEPGYYRITYYGSFWHILIFDNNINKQDIRYVHIPLVDISTSLSISALKQMVSIHSDFIGYVLESITYTVYTVGGRGTTTIQLYKNGVFVGANALINEAQKCVTQDYGLINETCSDFTFRISTIQSTSALGLSADMKFVAQ